MSKAREKGGKNQPKQKSTGKWVWPGIIFLLSFVMYANTIGHDYALDDDIYTRKNEFVKQGFKALPKLFTMGSLYGFNKQNDANYRPVVLLDFMIETALFKENPHVNHFFNILFWAIANVILYWFLLRIFQNYNRYIPLLIVGLFIVHPIHTDVVSNIKSRDEILGYLFAMACLLNVMKWISSWDRNDLMVFDRKALGYACLFFVLSTLCKENSVTLVAIIPVMMYTFSDLKLKNVLIGSVPFIVLIGLYFAVRAHVLSSVTFTDEKIPVVNNSLMAATNKMDMYATNFSMLGRYLRLLFYPHPLSWDYSYNSFPIISWSDYRAYGALLIYMGLIGYAAVRFWKRDVFAFCIIFYLATLILTSNLIIKIQATFAERFLFMPSLGFCIAIVFLLFKAFKTDIQGSRISMPQTLGYTFGGVMFIFAIMTWSRTPDWKDNMTLFSAALSSQPNSGRVHFAVASEYRSRAEAEGNPVVKTDLFNKAIEQYKEGMKIYDKDAEIWYNLGITYMGLGDQDKAMESYKKTIDMRPNYVAARNNLGVLFFNRKQYDSAFTVFKSILKYDTTYSDAYGNLGAVSHNVGKFQEAIDYYKKAAKLNKDNYTVYENMSRSALGLRDSVAAREYTNSASLIKERVAKLNPPVNPSSYSEGPVVFLAILTLVGFIGLIVRTRNMVA